MGSPDNVQYQIGLNCIFNPALRNMDSDYDQLRAPATLMDVEGVRNFRLIYLPDDYGIVKWAQVEALLDCEPFHATCLVCSSCGSCFSGNFDGDPQHSWKKVGSARFLDHSRRRSMNDSPKKLVNVCNSCFSTQTATGASPSCGRGLIEKVPDMFPQGAVSIKVPQTDLSRDFPSKRKRTTTARWDPTDPSSHERRSITCNSRASNLRGRSRSQDAGASVRSEL